ncbi:MAG TPA: hypothetical protein VJ739_02065, partial [Gemmataceae bacterium]|nr:hypothetical protein [Gemmataceae bacterium]
DIDSFNFLHAMWPRLTIGSAVDWNGDGSPNGPWILEGQECLVFFTGGIPSSGSPATTLGFSPNPANPAAAVTGGTRKGPYYPYDSSRLLRNASTNFLSYADPLSGKPYAYFSSFSYWSKAPLAAGGVLVPVPNRYGPTGATPVGNTGVSDCNSLGVSPYADVATNPTVANPPIPHYLNADTFQIISAGADGVFGQGSMNNSSSYDCSWSPNTAGKTMATAVAGGNNPKAAARNMANFYSNLLGIAP